MKGESVVTWRRLAPVNEETESVSDRARTSVRDGSVIIRKQWGCRKSNEQL